MPVRVKRGTWSAIDRCRGGFVVQVQGGTEADRIAIGLSDAVQRIGLLHDPEVVSDSNAHDGGPAMVTEPLETPIGPFIAIEAADWPTRLLRRIVEVVVESLDDAGVDHAVVAVPTEAGPWRTRGITERAATLHLYVQPTHRLAEYPEFPQPWLESAWSWLEPIASSTGTVWLKINHAILEVPWQRVDSVVERYLDAALVSCSVVAFSEDESLCRPARCDFGMAASLKLAGGGPGTDDRALVEEAHRLIEIGRSLAPDVAYAPLTLSAGFFDIYTGNETTQDVPKAQHHPVNVWRVCDVAVGDAFPYQILGPGHHDRLGRWPPGAVEIPGGRAELFVGELTDWLPERHEFLQWGMPDSMLTPIPVARRRCRAVGRALLADLFITPPMLIS